MRNGQQKRMRGRQNTPRRGSNPLTRVYESNGPDVKVRGTAHHIAEKYQQLARDAQSSGDYVAAENHYQHAEHYLRLIATLQAQFAPQQGFSQPGDDMDDDEGEEIGGLDAPQPYQQPREQFQPRDNYQHRDHYQQRDPRQGRDDRPQQRDDRQDRPQRDDRQDRQPRENRQNGYQRNNRDDQQAESYQQHQQPPHQQPPREARRNRDDDQGGGYAPRAPRPPREEDQNGNYSPAPRAPRPPREERAERPERVAREEEAPQLGLPSFITGGGVRPEPREFPQDEQPRVEAVVSAPAEAAAPEGEDTGEEGARYAGTRRRRSRYRTRGERPEGGEEQPAAEQPSFNE